MEFSSFSRLPGELRTAIWQEALKIYPRIFEIHWASGEGFSCHVYPSALLNACKESYSLAHEFYHRYENPTIWPVVGTFAPSVLNSFNEDVDTIYFPYPFSCAESCGRSLNMFFYKSHFSEYHSKGTRLKHFAIAVPPPSQPPTWEDALEGPDILYFDHVWAIAFNLPILDLESITLAYDDSIMRLVDSEGPPVYSRSVDFGVARKFLLQDNMKHRRPVPKYWGAPAIKLRTVDRRYNAKHLISRCIDMGKIV